jgi:outer membrane protease
MKRKFLLKLTFIFSLLCITVFLFAETGDNLEKSESSYQFSAAFSAGMLHGSSFELVYRTKNDVLSELRWDMKPLFYLGAFAEFARRNPLEKPGFYANLGVKAGIPAKTGFMEDRDWMSANNQLSHFSKHDNNTKSTFFLDASLGFSVPLFDSLIITPVLGFHYMYYRWIARDGYYQYAENGGIWDESLKKKAVFGSAVGYSQDWFLFSLGISLKYPFLERFLLEGSFLFSPLIYIAATDDHYLTKTRFYDESKGGYMLEPALILTFSFNRRIKLNLKASYRYIRDSQGYSYAYDSESNAYKGASLAGAEYEMWDAGINFIYSF